MAIMALPEAHKNGNRILIITKSILISYESKFSQKKNKKRLEKGKQNYILNYFLFLDD